MLCSQWDDDTLVLVISSSPDLEGCIDVMMLANDPDLFRKHFREQMQAAHRGALKGKNVVVNATGTEADGKRGLAIDWSDRDGGFYMVKLDGPFSLPIKVSAGCVTEWNFPVSEEAVSVAMEIMAMAVFSIMAGDCEGAIALLKGPSAPPLAWKQHAGVGRETWAGFESMLGSAYLERLMGMRAANVEAAIAHFTAALSAYSEQGEPVRTPPLRSRLPTRTPLCPSQLLCTI